MFFVKSKENIVWMNKLYVKSKNTFILMYYTYFQQCWPNVDKCWTILKWVIRMSHFNRVSWKLQTTLEIIFWLMKWLLKLLTFMVKNAQNWWKWPKRFYQYFPRNHRYGCNCFCRLLYTPWATSHPNIMAVNKILQKPPWLLLNSCLFWHFWGDFDILDIQYPNSGNPWPKIWKMFFMP